MREYEIVAVFWEDHIRATRSPLPDNPDDVFERPMLSVGILFEETDKSILLVSDFERYEDRDDATYMVILKNTIVGTKRYGTIELDLE